MLQRLRRLQADERFGEILTGSAFALAARAVAAVCGVGLNVAIARWYGAEQVGVVAMVQAFLLLGTTFTLLGTGTSILRLIPEHVAKYSAASAFCLYRKVQRLVVAVSLVAGGILFGAAGLVAAGVFRKPHLAPYFAWAAVFVAFEALVGLNTAAVRGLRLIRTFALMQILVPALALLFVLVGTSLGEWPALPVYAYLGAVGVSGVTGAVIMEAAFRRRVVPQEQVHPVSVRELLSISTPMMLTSGMTLVMAQVGVIFLGIFRSEAEVGYYAVAVKLATMTTFMLTAVNSMAASKFSELYHQDRIDDLFYVARKSARLIFWSTTPVLVGLVVFGWWLLKGMFGVDFVAAYPALVLLAAGQFVNAASGSTGMFMNMTGLQRQFRNIIVVACILQVGGSLLLIPPFGVTGAAGAAMVSVSFWNVATLGYIKSRHGRTVGYLPRLFETQPGALSERL